MNDKDRQIFDGQAHAMDMVRDLRELMEAQVETKEARLRQWSWRGEVGAARYQAMDVGENKIESVVLNESGKEAETIEITYDRTRTPSGETENLVSQTGLSERQSILAKRALFFLRAIDEAIRRTIEEQQHAQDEL